MKLYRTYGDYLYKKEEYELSVQQYCHTIGFLQPSYVVRRFLDPHRVVNLVHYLEKLQEKGLASNDHAVLLLTCYTKMENSQKILSYIYTCSNKPAPSQYTPSTSLLGIKEAPAVVASIDDWLPDDSLTEAQSKQFSRASGFVDFEADASVDILKHAGMTNEALVLARRCERHMLTMELLMDRAVTDEGINAAVTHMTELVLSLHSVKLLTIIHTHAPRLLRVCPDVVTELLVRLVTGELDTLRQRALKREIVANKHSSDGGSSGAVTVDDVLRVYADNTAQLQVFLESVLDNRRSHQGAPLPQAVETLLEIYLAEYQELHFAVGAAAAQGKNKGEIAVAKKAEKTSEKRILSFLDGHLTDTYDPSQALLLVHAAGCDAAGRFLLDRMQSTELLMQKHIESGDEKGIFKVLRREGRKDPELYVHVLGYFVKQAMAPVDDSDDEEERWDSISEVLRLVEGEGSLSPMQIVSVLAQHPQLPFSLVAKYIGSSLKDSCEDIGKLEANLVATTQTLEDVKNGYLNGTGQSRSRVISVSSDRNNRSNTNSPSPLRMKHKKGGSSQRLRALDRSSMSDGYDSRGSDPFSDDDEDASVDADDTQSLGSASVSSRDRQLLQQQQSMAEREKWEKIKQLAVKRASDHESFFAELEGSEDGFSTVAAAFGKTEMMTN